jgi:hypothetical protein
MFTSLIGRGYYTQPEENFMKVSKPFSRQVKDMLYQEIRHWDRWK